MKISKEQKVVLLTEKKEERKSFKIKNPTIDLWQWLIEEYENRVHPKAIVGVHKCKSIR